MDLKVTAGLTSCSSIKDRKGTDISIFVDENIAKLYNKKRENAYHYYIKMLHGTQTSLRS
jgi:hypothetical protein